MTSTDTTQHRAPVPHALLPFICCLHPLPRTEDFHSILPCTAPAKECVCKRGRS